MNGRTGAVITAAGLSSRMLDFKPLMLLDGKAIINHVIDKFKNIGVSSIVVVTGHRALELEDYLKNEGVLFARNKDYMNTDMFTSVKIGIEALRDSCSEIFVTPGDIPLVKKSTLLYMQSEFLISGYAYMIPEFNGRKGHPLLVRGEYIDKILSYTGDRGLRGALEQISQYGIRIEVNDNGILLDSDTQEDFLQIYKVYNERKRNTKNCGLLEVV